MWCGQMGAPLLPPTILVSSLLNGFQAQDVVTTLSSEQQQDRSHCQVNEKDHCIILGKPVSECQQYVPGRRYYNTGTHHHTRIDNLLHRSFLVDQYRTHCLHTAAPLLLNGNEKPWKQNSWYNVR